MLPRCPLLSLALSSACVLMSARRLLATGTASACAEAPTSPVRAISLEEAVFHREQCCAGAGGDSGLVVDVLDVVFDRVVRKRELVGHDPVGVATRHEPQHLNLPVAE